MLKKKECRDIATGVGFLAPNILGFLAFTLVPLLISFVMAFTNWDLEQHNVFRHEPLQFVGFENFIELFTAKDFYKFLGNTLFFMMGIPLGVAGSLLSAVLLSSDFRGGSRRVWIAVVATVGLVIGCGAMVIAGLGATAMTLLICGLAGLVLLGGSLGGQTVYRTLFYFPHFTAGVATFLLWKKLYSPDTGPINSAIRPILAKLEPVCASMTNGEAMTLAGAFTLLLLALCLYGVYRWVQQWRDGESGAMSLLIAALFLTLPVGFVTVWTPFLSYRMVALLPLAVAWGYVLYALSRGRAYSTPLDRGLADAVVVGGALMALSFALIGFSRLAYHLPTMAADGFEAPKWINDYHWAKPSIMIMGFWAAVGSNNMLLYLAGLSGVPQELYEAADIDGANGRQRFWHVTWPQLAPITFFILVMAIIGGLQGGFEMARTMTNGGPFHATTTLSYYIYTEGFSTGRLGYASAVSWALFALVFTVTIFNWKFGNRYTNE